MLLVPVPSWGERWHRLIEEWGEDSFNLLREHVPKILSILIVVAVLWHLLNVLTDRLITISKRQDLPSTFRAQQLRTLAGVVHGGGMFLIFFFAGLTILQQLRVNVGPLLASAGVLGLAIGFGAQALVKDVINGFFILFENQYDVGDTVKIGAVQGTVEMMTLRRTMLRDADGTQHIIPNSMISIVSNLTRDWTQISLHISVDYKEDSDRIISLLNEVGMEVRNDPQFRDAIVADPQVPGIDRFHGGEVDYLMTVKTRPGEQYAVSRQMRRMIKHCFEKNNIQPGGQNRFFVVDSTLPPAARK
ncbi:MAG TPA: mechanosensitive ion channel family protein [Clostridia bacterium]|nr:mechanosensitive ion channel family protein [Clostridia bacterium]